MQTGSTEFSHIKNINLYFYRAADVLARQKGSTFSEERSRLEAKAAEATRGMTANQRDRHYKESAMAILKPHPWLTAQSMAAGGVRMLTSPGTASLYETMGGHVDRQ